MGGPNIFETIQRTTRRTEPFHSQYLGDVLDASLAGDRSLFDAVWKLCAPVEWAPPARAKVSTEFPLDGAQRIDVLIKDSDNGLVLGIEVKTSRASARAGQLEGYLQGLRKENEAENIALAYLTPFNRAQAERFIGDDAATLSTVKVFDEFQCTFDRSRHVSWLDVAGVDWEAGGEVWSQHRAYVREKMANGDTLRGAMERNRSLREFFSAEAVDRFDDALLALSDGDHSDDGVTIELARLDGDAAELTRALAILIEDGEHVAQRAEKEDRFDDTLRERFLNSRCGEVHDALFSLAKYPHVWLQGSWNYGLRVAHKRSSGGVSLVTSQDVDRLKIGGRR